MKCNFVFFVSFDRDGDREEMGIEKEFELDFRPMVGDECSVCGDSPFYVSEVSFDADSGAMRADFGRGPELDSVQRWIDSGFRLHDTGVELPEGLNWNGSQGVD